MPGIQAKRSQDSAQPQHQTSSFLGVWLAMVVCIVLLIGCGSSGSAQPAGTIINQLVSTTGCSKSPPIQAGTSADETIASGGLNRSYRLHLPTGYQVKQPQAIILAFHGYSMNVHDMEQYTGLSTLADQEDFIAVYPQGSLDSENQPAWATGGGSDPSADDILFVSDLLNHLQATLCIDAQRIYVTGYSNGGGMAGLLACVLAKRIAAFAPVAGAFYPAPGGCHPGRSVPILEFHGTADPVVIYTGGSQNGWEAIPNWLQEWVMWDGCSSRSTVFMQIADVTGEQWSGCATRGAVVHYRIEGGGHTWPGSKIDVSEEGSTTHTIDADVIMWQFFQAHPLLNA